MTWFKIDDKLALHPKVLAAGNAAIGLWVRAGSWSADQLTDGKIPATMLTVLGATKRDAKRLVDAGLWETTPDGYQFHDWHEYNPTADAVRQGRSAMTNGSTRGNHARWHAARGITDPECPHCQKRGSK